MSIIPVVLDIILLFTVVFLALNVVRFRDLAYRDQLTGIYNTRYLYRQEKRFIERARKNGSKICFFFVDLDRLKSINDNHSHEIGDKAIQKIASVLKKFFHLKTDLVVRRNKGDEFICVCQTNKKAAEIFAEDLQKRLKHLIINTGESNIYISATLGYFCAAPHIGVFKKVENRADACMIKNKKKRKEDT